MREVDSDNSANNSLREFNHRSSQVNQSTAASNVNVRNNEDHDDQRQQDRSPGSNRGNPNAVIPERFVQFRENRNRVLQAGDICRICGDVHDENLVFYEPQPWEVAAPFVGTAVPGNGFFVIPDIRNAAPAKKIFQGVVEVLEGDISANQLEKEFTQWAGNSCNWRWYAKPMSAKKFLMRFPSARDIDAWIHFGRTNLRTIQNVVLKVNHWFPRYGATGDLDIAWF
jgi:hypothetical protein